MLLGVIYPIADLFTVFSEFIEQFIADIIKAFTSLLNVYLCCIYTVGEQLECYSLKIKFKDNVMLKLYFISSFSSENKTK